VKPVWLLDVDGVLNACTKVPDRNVWTKDQWDGGKASASGREWPIMWARPVAEFIRTVHAQDRAEIRWHTTWQHEASAIADLLGLPEFAIADAPEFLAHEQRTPASEAERIREGHPRPAWWKLPAAERVVRDEGRPLIWTDDDITWSLARYNADAGLRAHAPALLVSPNERTGLTPKHLRQIGDFLDLLAGA
jgi:hypothetical protein